jgi:hypothetical protein
MHTSDPCGRSAYTAYLELVRASQATDHTPPIPDEVLAEMVHVPILALIGLGRDAPWLRTLSIGLAPEPELMDLIVRRDLSPFAEPYQSPIGLLPPVGEKNRDETFGGVMRLFFMSNGQGRRTSSRPFLRSWPSAVIIGAALEDDTRAVSQILVNCAARAGLPFGEERWTVDDLPIVGWTVHPVSEAYTAWWDRVTHPDTISEAAARFPHVWRRAVSRSGRMPAVGLDVALSWLGESLAPMASDW